MGMTVDERFHPDLKEAVRRLVDCFQPDRIYLFGSRARGDAREDSDYDIMLVVPDTLEAHFLRVARAHELIEGIGLPIEVVIFGREQFERQSPVVASLSATVLREGELLYAA